MFRLFRRKPLGDIAECVIDLMEDPTRWRPGEKCLRHIDIDLVIRNDWGPVEAGLVILSDSNPSNEWPLAAAIGEAVFPFKDRDWWPVHRAYHKLRRRVTAYAEAVAAQQIREKLALPPDVAAVPAFPAESVEAVETRVRRLREAVLSASPGRLQSHDVVQQVRGAP